MQHTEEREVVKSFMQWVTEVAEDPERAAALDEAVDEIEDDDQLIEFILDKYFEDKAAE